MINNGHTVQVNYDAGSSITINGVSMPLTQFHFHHLSETEINGKSTIWSCISCTRSASGRAAVVAVLIKSGSRNPLLRELWSNIPRTSARK